MIDLINLTIYLLGVSALTLLLIAIASVSFLIAVVALRKLLADKLGSLYNHAQLYFFMAKLKEKGFAKCVNEIGKDDG